MSSIRVSHAGEIILTPPRLPSYLRAVHELKPIVGKPADEDVKAIHAVIRALGAVSHLPTFYNPDLSMQLSQYLFGVQMAVFRASYSMELLPGEKSVFIPPELPSHIPGALNQVVGAPSDEEIKLAQSALRNTENLAISPQLFDADLSMRLSQHFFNIQFAAGRFVPKTEPKESYPAASQPAHEIKEYSTITHELPNLHDEGRRSCPVPEVEQSPQELSEIAQLGEMIVKAIKEATSETKNVLESMNRVLTLIKQDQSTVGCTGEYYQVFKNPLNQQGVAASECGLPQLRYEYLNKGYRYHLWMSPDHTARYLKFFGIGDNLIHDGEEPKLIDGMGDEAGRLILAKLGVTRP
ncbi:unnamed protein product [Rhizoctonia solani]|uniref:Laminin domain protein n=1 Tax=Rhizoctonia solani TaxID=456999 RepID=A0A8H3BTM4_9AGAM|nr:unnamed protein product [Rhizoctonia solani]